MNELRARSGPRTLLGVLAASGLVAALAMPVVAGAEVDWATVTGYAEGTAANNNPDTWGEDCEDAGVNGVDTWVLPDLPDGEVYTLVVVKTASEQSAPGHVNTLFANPSEGETVWADSDGSGDFSEGDKGISHIIVCTGAAAPTPTPTPTASPTPSPTPVPPTPTPAESEAGQTPAPTPVPTGTPREGELGGTPTPAPSGGTVPDTAMGQFGQVPATVLSLVLLGALAAMIYIRLARQR